MIGCPAAATSISGTEQCCRRCAESPGSRSCGLRHSVFRSRNALGTLREEAQRLIDPTAHVHPTATIHGSVYVGRDAFIGPGVTVDRGAVVKAEARIEPGVWIRSGGAVIGHGAVLRAGAKVWRGASAHIRDGVEVGPGAWIGGGAEVFEDVPAGAKVPPVGARAGRSAWATLVASRGQGQVVDASAEIGVGVSLGPGVWIGRRTQVEAGAIIGAFAYIAAPHRRSLPGTRVGRGAIIGPGVWIRGGATDIGPEARVEAGARVLRGGTPTIGLGAIVGAGVRIGGDIVIGPGEIIPAGAGVGPQ